ncbi:MAG TPA: glycosyltransferase [Nitrospirae bacterium]|nr:putative glycosyltransferase EpsD [bacterium BMS3Abin06]HDH13557.1 glycosyltransferase [Nitrospirota bacterium]HDZ01003.1 glycosyltransferase [Nitrospirota bacterium]
MKDKIYVLHIVENLKIGGLERAIATIATGLDKNKFSVKVWCLVKGGEIFEELKDKGVDVEILGMDSHRDVLFFLRLCKKLRKDKIHILHTHGCTATTLGRLAGIFARTPVILSHMHSTYWTYTRKQLLIEKSLSFFTDKIICCSQAVADFAVDREKISPDRLTVIFNGTDVEKFEGNDPDKISDKKEFLIGCVASFFPHKGHRYLLEAARYIIDNFPNGVKFILVGRGILKEELKKYAETLGISSYVVFKEPVLDISNLLSSFDLMVLPSSEREGLGLAIIEAMAAGKPVVATSIGGVPEVIEDGKNGLLVPPGDSSSLAEAMLSVLENREKAKEMGRKGREVVKEKFSARVMLKKIANLYQSLIRAKFEESKI